MWAIAQNSRSLFFQQKIIHLLFCHHSPNITFNFCINFICLKNSTSIQYILNKNYCNYQYQSLLAAYSVIFYENCSHLESITAQWKISYLADGLLAFQGESTKLSLSVINSMFENLNSAYQKCMNPLVAKATTFYMMVPIIIISSLGLNLEHVDYEISLFIFDL